MPQEKRRMQPGYQGSVTLLAVRLLSTGVPWIGPSFLGRQEMAEHVPVLNSPSIWVRVLPFFHIVLKLFCHFYICGLEVNPGQSRYEKMAEQYEKFENMYPY